MGRVLSLNVGVVRPTAHSDMRVTGIDKRPVSEAVMIRDPGPRGTGGSGVTGDPICNLRVHGGSDQAVYAYAREDLDMWEREMERTLPSGVFGENLTTEDLDVTGTRIGDRWAVGDACVLEVTGPRVPCRTFAGWLQDQRWVRTFTLRGVPGAYLRVIAPGEVRAGDPITLVHRPEHDITIGFMFRALTTEKRLFQELAAAGAALPVRERRALGIDDSG